MTQDFIQQIDGYDGIVQEIEAGRQQGIDYAQMKGKVAEVLDRYHPARMTLRVDDIREETASTKTFRLVSDERPLPPFQAGQYVALLLQFDNVRTTRAYSMSSPPNEGDHYDLTVRRMPDGLVSNYLLDQVKVGDTLETSGPTGNFHFNPVFHDNHMVLLAGGCGITPFMSMIREVVARGLDRTIHLFYGNQGIDDIVFHGELASIAADCDNIHYIPVIEKEGCALTDAYPCQFGFITADILQRELGDVDGKTFYMCGPSAMYDFCAAELDKLGVPKRRIRRELYGAPASVSKCPGWPEGVSEDATFEVTLNGGQTIPARAGESLLTALEKAGIVIPSLCRSGECSLCRVRLTSGEVFQPEGVLLRASDRQFGYIHSCAAYPLGDVALTL